MNLFKMLNALQIYQSKQIAIEVSEIMNKQVQKLASLLNPETSPSDIEPICSKILRQNFISFQEKCHSFFLVSHVYYTVLNDLQQAQKILESLLAETISDKQQVQCLGRLSFINIFENRIKAGRYYYDKAINIINEALDNQKKSLKYTLFWIFSEMKNPGSNNPHSNLVLAYVEEAKHNYEQAAVMFKKILKHQSKINHKFVKWKIDNLDQDKNKKTISQFQQLDLTFRQFFRIFTDVTHSSIVEDADLQKKKALAHLKEVFDKYYNNAQYSDILDFLQDQIAHLETDDIPLGLIDSINSKHNNVSSNEIQLLPHPTYGSQYKNLTTNSYMMPNNTSQPSRMINSTQLVIPKPNNLSYPTNNPINASNYLPTTSLTLPPRNVSSSSNIYLKPPIGWIGSELVKLNYTTDGQKIKFFYIGNPGLKRMYYCQRKDKPDTKFDSYYDLHSIKDVKEGKVTKALLRKSSAKYDQQLSFSIILENKTRDFIALNLQDYNYWIYTLKRFLSGVPEVASIQQSRSMSPTSTSLATSKQQFGSLYMSRK